MMDRLRHPWTWALVAILIGALWLRLASIGFGLPALNDPDELMFELGAIRMLRGVTLNPGWFGHPATTTMYVLALVNIGMFLVGWLAGWFPSVTAFATAIYADPTWMILPGRVAMTLFGLGTILLTFRLGRRLIDARAGLIGAALMAASPVHVTYSQIIRSDMMACFFMLLCILAALDILERNRWRDYVRASLWLGLAVATKWPFALSGLAVGGAVALLVAQGRLRLDQAIMRLFVFGLLSLVFLILLSPYLLLDHATVVRNLTGEGQARHLGSTGGTAWQNARWYLAGPLRDGLGLAGLVLMPVGMVFLRRNRAIWAIMLPLGISFFLLLCFQTMVWERWALPLLPLGALLIAAGIGGLADRLAARLKRHAGPALVAAMMAAIIVPQMVQGRTDARERMQDTRQVASRWARTHIPAGSSVLIEHFAFDLINEPWHFLFPIGEAGCVDALAMLRGKTSYAPIDQARGTRANVDYGTMAARRRADCRPDFAILTQYDRYRRERANFPAEYDAYSSLIARGRVVAVVAPQPDIMGGRVVTIVAFPKDP